MRIGIVGCGFVADLYAGTLRCHPQLELAGVTDLLPVRASRFAALNETRVYATLAEMLGDPGIELVLNLTNPRSHFDVSAACLKAGKHVYSEKPLAMQFDRAAELVARAQAQGLQIVSAPCSLLGETAQTLWKALREGVVGPVRVVYAELDEGMIHRMRYRQWFSPTGTPWPWKDEFEVGCTIEHAAYYLTWLVAYFGPVDSVTAFASCQIPDKQTDEPLPIQSPDFSVACLQFRSGVVARLTCGIVAPHDHSLRIVGDDGILGIGDCWDFQAPIYIQRPMTIRRKTFMNPWTKRYPLLKGPAGSAPRRGAAAMDFCRGVAQMADAIQHGQEPALSSRFCLHINEIVLAIHNACRGAGRVDITTTFDAPEPMEWAATRTEQPAVVANE